MVDFPNFGHIFGFVKIGPGRPRKSQKVEECLTVQLDNIKPTADT